MGDTSQALGNRGERGGTRTIARATRSGMCTSSSMVAISCCKNSAEITGVHVDILYQVHMQRNALQCIKQIESFSITAISTMFILGQN